MYKRLTTPFAFDGLLRLRCPPELCVAAAHGHLSPDPRHDNLLLCGGCTPHDCMVLDLEYVKPNVGFSRRTEAQGAPVLQLVFQYSVLVPQGSEGGADEPPNEHEEGSLAALLAGRCVKDKAGISCCAVDIALLILHVPPPCSQLHHHHVNPCHRFTLERRLRVCTHPLDLAREGLAVLQGARADAVAACLLQRVLRVGARDGATEARLLLRDWLVNLTARYNWLCRASARLPQVLPACAVVALH